MKESTVIRVLNRASTTNVLDRNQPTKSRTNQSQYHNAVAFTIQLVGQVETMDKRKHPNAQLTKEEYEALEAQGGGSSVSNDSFKKASVETLGGRRIIKTSR